MSSLIEMDRSIIPACDVRDLDHLKSIVDQTALIDEIGGYKVGFTLGLSYGLPAVVEAVRESSDKPVIYDHQKAGTDIPDTGADFAAVAAGAGVDAVILFPQAGPETQQEWTQRAQEAGLTVIIGGQMTHTGYLDEDGGYILDNAPMRMYMSGVEQGVTDFVVPGNDPESIHQIRQEILMKGIEPVFYAPGFIAQGGNISKAANASGKRWHAIVGRGIYNAEKQGKSFREAALELTDQLR